MKSKKTISITTKAFSLQLYWNGLLASAQIAILLGLLVLYVFSMKPEMVSFCKLVLVIDLVALLVYALYGMKVEVTEGEAPTIAPTAKPAQVNSNTSNTNQSSVRQTNGTINNKVPMPSQQGVQRANPTPQPQPQPQPQQQTQPQPEPEDNPAQAEENAAREGQRVSRELSPSDWEDLFSM